MIPQRQRKVKHSLKTTPKENHPLKPKERPYSKVGTLLPKSGKSNLDTPTKDML